VSEGGRIQEIDEETCRKLLARRHFGRVALVDDHGPIIFPVNYAVDDGSIVFRTDRGTKRSAAAEGRPACFEIDDVDTRRRFGWSVIVRGRLDEVMDDGGRERLSGKLIEPYPGGPKEHLVRLSCTSISGRRVPLPEDAPEDEFEGAQAGHLWRGQDASDLLG